MRRWLIRLGIGLPCVAAWLVLMAWLTLRFVPPAEGQFTPADRTVSGTLSTAGQVVSVLAAGYQTASVTFSGSTLSGASLLPVCSYDGGTTHQTSGDYKFSDVTDEDVVQAALDEGDNLAQSYTISCGATSPTHIGVELDAVTSGSVAVVVRVKAVRAWYHFWPELVYKTLNGLRVVVVNVVEIGGKSATGSTDAITYCTGGFNLLLDTDTTATQQIVAADPAAGEFVRICEFQVLITATTGSANISIVQGTGVNCGTDKTTVRGPWPVVATGNGTPGFNRGGGVGAIVRGNTAAYRLCFETDSATAVRVEGTVAVH